MKLLWIHKELLNMLKESPGFQTGLSDYYVFYGNVEELEEQLGIEFGENQIKDWYPFFTMGD